MPSVNKVILIGNLGADPDVRYLPDGKAVANFNLATNETYTNKEGKKQDKTEWHKVVAFGKLGEICGEYLKKGKQVYIEGRLRTRAWEDKEGNKKYTTEVVIGSMQMLGSSGRDQSAPGGKTEPEAASQGESFDGIPF